MLKSILCDYSDVYILVKETIAVANTVTAGAAANNDNKKAIFKKFPPFTVCIRDDGDDGTKDDEMIN